MRGVYAAGFALLAAASAFSAEMGPALQTALIQDESYQIAQDETWPRRAAGFLEAQYGISQEDWKLVADGRKREIIRDWLKQRGDALQARRIVMLQGKPASEEQARQMRLLAANGFLDPAELKGVEHLHTASGNALLDAAAIQPGAFPEIARADAGRQFRQTSPGVRSPPVHTLTAAPLKGLAPTAKDDLEVVYRTAQMMVMDPEGFAKTRSELVTPNQLASEREKQGRLRQQLGHLFATANRLRAEGRLEFRLDGDDELKNAFGESEITDVKDPRTGALDWKIVIHLHEKYKDADPALLAPTMVHELEHAYNDSRRIDRYGLAVARRMDDFQEEEERAFIAESYLAPAYASSLRRARDRNSNDEAIELNAEAEKLGALDDVRSTDNLRYRAALKDVAYLLLRRNDYIKHRDSLNSLAEAKRSAEDDLMEAKAERILLTRGQRGVQEELKKPGDPRFKAHLLDIRHQQATETVESLDAKAVETRSLLKLIEEERRRGLDLL